MQIELDIFPANVTIAPPDAYHEVFEVSPTAEQKKTFYVDVTRVVVFWHIPEGEQEQIPTLVIAQDTPTGAQIIFQERLTFLEKPNKDNSTGYAITVNGKMLAFRKDSNCGCGSRLRSWNPYKTLTSMKGL